MNPASATQNSDYTKHRIYPAQSSHSVALVLGPVRNRTTGSCCNRKKHHEDGHATLLLSHHRHHLLHNHMTAKHTNNLALQVLCLK